MNTTISAVVIWRFCMKGAGFVSIFKLLKQHQEGSHTYQTWMHKFYKGCVCVLPCHGTCPYLGLSIAYFFILGFQLDEEVQNICKGSFSVLWDLSSVWSLKHLVYPWVMINAAWGYAKIQLISYKVPLASWVDFFCVCLVLQFPCCHWVSRGGFFGWQWSSLCWLPAK